MVRSIEFIIPGIPEVLITAIEQDDGTILFTSTVLGDADIRGLFFDLAGVDAEVLASGSDITDQDLDTINLGGGVNMNGEGRDEYDVGIEFGTSGAGNDLVTATEFKLATTDGSALTLDAIAHVEFGVRLTSIDGNGSAKNTVIAPAAPDAIDDTADTLEDEAVVIDAVGNDTDADMDALSIVGVDNPLNGTAQIVDNQIVYTPDEHWSGTETFEYKIDDGNGGMDCAEITINVEAVADAPNVAVEAIAGANVQEVVLKIDSSLVDLDGSESLALEISGLPAGVAASTTSISNPGAVEFVTLTLPEGQDFDFEVTVTATSTESSNGDMASSAVTQDVLFTHNFVEQTITLEANDANQWGEGEEFTFDDVRELGFDTGRQSTSGELLGAFDYSFAVDLEAGLRSDLHFGGGEIDADVPYELTFETGFNETTDVLQLDTTAFLASGGSFLTDGPELTYDLDFYVNLFANATVGIDIGPFDENLINATLSSDGEKTLEILSFDSDTSPSISAEFPFGISGDLTWPNLEVSGVEGALGTYSGYGESNNFLDIGLDIDDLLADIFLAGANPFDLGAELSVLGQSAGFNVELLDADLLAGAKFAQAFDLEVGDLEATLVFEDGSSQAFIFGESLVFDNASALDVNGDGNIDFDFTFDIDDTMVTNNTDLQFNVGWNFDVAKASAYYDTLLGSGSTSIGPLIDLGESEIPVAFVDVYSDTFELNFDAQDYLLVA